MEFARGFYDAAAQKEPAVPAANEPGSLGQASWLHLRRRYGTVVTHTLPDPLVFTAIVPRLLGARVIIDMHEYTPELFQTRYGIGARHPLIRLAMRLERWSCAFAHVVVTVHDPGARLLEGRGIPASKLVVIPNTAPGAVPLPEAERPKGGRPFTLLYHGLLSNQYDLATGLRAMKLLGDRGVHARLRIVGEGPDEPELRRLAAELGVDLATVVTRGGPDEPVRAALAQRFGIDVRWNVEGFGYLFLTADNGGEHYTLPPDGRTQELNLNVELAKSRVHRNRRRLSPMTGRRTCRRTRWPCCGLTWKRLVPCSMGVSDDVWADVWGVCSAMSRS